VSLTKISQEEREKLANTMSEIIHIIGNIEDDDLKNILCQNVIDMCDQMKSRLTIDLYKNKRSGWND
jgi:Asp-tRNA(Asn)/Glu-tRNA(Gln) amidotransferase C subunit